MRFLAWQNAFGKNERKPKWSNPTDHRRAHFKPVEQGSAHKHEREAAPLRNFNLQINIVRRLFHNMFVCISQAKTKRCWELVIGNKAGHEAIRIIVKK